MKKDSTFLDTLMVWVVVATVFFLPLFFLPITIDAFGLPKVALLVVATVLLLILWLVKMVLNKEIKLVITPLNIPLLLFTLANIASLIIVAPNKIQPLITPGSVGTIITLFIWFFLVSNLSFRKLKLVGYGLKALTLSVTVLSAITLLSISGTTAKLALPDFFKITTFNPTGSPLTFLTVAIVTIVISGGSLLAVFMKEGDKNLTPPYKKFLQHTRGQLDRVSPEAMPATRGKTIALLSLSIIIILVGLSATIYQLSFLTKPILLPYWAGWTVAIEGLKRARTALFGVGPANFITAFTLYKPLRLNTTPLSNLSFATSSNYYLQVLSETGLLGLTTLVFFIYKLIRASISFLVKHDQQTMPSLMGALAILAVWFFLPANVTLLFIMFTLAALLGPQIDNVCLIRKKSYLLPIILAVLTELVLLPTLYLAGRAYAAEIVFKQVVEAIKNNQATLAYNQNIKALQLNPFIDLYHLTYSQTNLSIANHLAQKQTTNEKTRATISQLVKQAIREAKSAVAANPQKSANWENLANTYRSLIQIAEGADSWSVKVYRRAIALNPTNPFLRLALGGVFYSLGRYKEAISQFQIAVALKPDFANGYYNLAAAYQEIGDYDNALAAMEQVVKNVPTDSPDFDLAKSQLEKLKKKLPVKPVTTGTDELLTLPATAPANLRSPIALPSEAAPPLITPSPSPRKR